MADDTQTVDKAHVEEIAEEPKLPGQETELEPKPAHRTYQRFLRMHGVDPEKAAMFEDLARNLVVPHDLGMTTTLVVPDGTKNVVREDWELEGRDAAHVDHITDDLTGFLQNLLVR